MPKVESAWRYNHQDGLFPFIHSNGYPVPDFARKRRLTQAREFEQVIRHPEINLSSGPLRIRARKNTLSHARLGVVVPKRGTALAVRRNRVKRIIREQFRSASGLPSLDIVVQVFAEMDDDQLVGGLVRQWRKLSEYSHGTKENRSRHDKGNDKRS